LNAALLIVMAVVIAVLTTAAFGPSLLDALRSRRKAVREVRGRHPHAAPAYDPGRERRAERKALELLGSVVSAEEFAMYRELGFLSVAGAGEEGSGYAYLIYPHRPIVAYDTANGELLNEYCVGFPDRSPEADGARLPDSDDVLAKWMSLRGGERNLIAEANMNVPGRQVDPGQVKRDLIRLREWRGRRQRQPGATPQSRRRKSLAT
jgi:hypothetical protein